MNRYSSESGSHLIALAIAVVVLGVVGFGGYRVWMMQQPAATTASTQASATTTTPVTVPKTITTTAQLNLAASALDSAATQVNASLDDSALNADLSSLL